MKTVLKKCMVLPTIAILTLLILGSCKKDDDHKDPIDQLPPATQTGAGTFAALVDGKPFIDKSGGWFNCFYQFVDEGYYFGIQGLDNVEDLTSITLGTERKEIFEGETYALMEIIEGNAWGGGLYDRYESLPIYHNKPEFYRGVDHHQIRFQ